MKKYRVEAFTAMGILMYEPLHKSRKKAEQHQATLKKENPSMNFGIIEESLREERNNAVFGES